MKVDLTPEECAAVVARINGTQTILRLPDYGVLLASAADKIESALDGASR